jgi:hypothetical protein
MPKSPAFEFYLMKLLLEQNMNQVNKNFPWRTISRFELEEPTSQSPAGQAYAISSISAPRQAPR